MALFARRLSETIGRETAPPKPLRSSLTRPRLAERDRRRPCAKISRM